MEYVVIGTMSLPTESFGNNPSKSGKTFEDLVGPFCYLDPQPIASYSTSGVVGGQFLGFGDPKAIGVMEPGMRAGVKGRWIRFGGCDTNLQH